MHSHLIVRICRHTFSDGRHCQGPAVRGRACCRHHLDARARLHNLARARLLACIPRLCVPTTRLDLAFNRAEVLRVVNAGALSTSPPPECCFEPWISPPPPSPPSQPPRPRRARNPNVFYYVPLNPLFSQSCTENLSQVPENTGRRGEGVHLNHAYSARARFRANHKKTGMPDTISPQPHIEFRRFSWNV